MISRKYNTPREVQKLIRTFAYNREENGPTVRSAALVWKSKRAHCLESTLLAAALLEHHGYPPLVMSLESKDRLDHMLYVFKKPTGWGAISRSREEGLHGRAPRFRALRDLAYSYFDPFIDLTGRLTGYALTNLDHSGTNWRYSSKNLWMLENFLIELKHKRIPGSQRRYQKVLEKFKFEGEGPALEGWW